MDAIKKQAEELTRGAKTWRFWINGTISALIGGGFGAVSSVFGILAAEVTGLDVGNAISIHGILSVFAVGAIGKASYFLKEFNLDEK